MNDLISQVEQGVLEREYPVFIALFMIIVIVIAVLSFIVISQNKKINELQKPRYGFLGKPLAVIMVLGLMVGSYGVIFMANKTATGVDSVSADKEISLEIKYQNVGRNNYLFKVTPIVNGKVWGNDPENLFDAYWTFTGSSVKTEIELDVSMNKSGGVVVELDNGKYNVKVTAFHEGKSYEKEMEIDLVN